MTLKEAPYIIPTLQQDPIAMVVGKGGREEATIKQLAPFAEVIGAPGNGGTLRTPNTRREHINPNNVDEIVEAAQDVHANIVIVGPETPLIKGAATKLREKNIAVVGPDENGADLEGRKSRAIDFMDKYRIRHPRSIVFNNLTDIYEFLENRPLSWIQKGGVLKWDEEAAGKGVDVFGTDWDRGKEVARHFMVDRPFGGTANQIIIQEQLQGGFEVSAIALVTGKKERAWSRKHPYGFTMLPYGIDYKPRYDDDSGITPNPNTGSMGGVFPHPFMTPELAQQIEEEVIKRTVYGFQKERIDYRGYLYAGLYVRQRMDGLYIIDVLEYNCRNGDSETQGQNRIVSDEVNHLDVLTAIANGDKPFEGPYPTKENTHAVVVNLVSGGYPESYKKGYPITGIEEAEQENGVVIYHAGTELDQNGNLVTDGGRVLNVTANDETLEGARRKAYNAAEKIKFQDQGRREDIGKF